LAKFDAGFVFKMIYFACSLSLAKPNNVVLAQAHCSTKKKNVNGNFTDPTATKENHKK